MPAASHRGQNLTAIRERVGLEPTEGAVMAERDGYIPGVPCWIGTGQPDPQAAVVFYGDLFGWESQDVGGDAPYYVARIRGGDVAGIAASPDGSASWDTYIWVDSADETAAKVRDAGGSVVAEPMDIGDAGRMAVLADPDGAVFRVWQAGEHKGARVVNEHGSLNFNTLHTRDAARAEAFYGAVFGWRTLDIGSGTAWGLAGYGDHLEALTPGMRKGMQEMGAPEGFEDVVAALAPLADDGAAPHWSVTFAVDDADAVAARAAELGGTVLAPPADGPWVRLAVIADPAGATFTASQFVVENRDLQPQGEGASTVT
jgi:predicted enzyme related to lactoylglutathione lyase